MPPLVVLFWVIFRCCEIFCFSILAPSRSYRYWGTKHNLKMGANPCPTLPQSSPPIDVTIYPTGDRSFTDVRLARPAWIICLGIPATNKILTFPVSSDPPSAMVGVSTKHWRDQTLAGQPPPPVGALVPPNPPVNPWRQPL